jgi:hypothetical protein
VRSSQGIDFASDKTAASAGHRERDFTGRHGSRRARCSLNRIDRTVRWHGLAGKSRFAQTIPKLEGFGRVMRRPASTLRRLRAGFRMSKVVQVHAAIARRGFAVPTHLDRMGSDAGHRAQSGGLTAVLADPDDAVAQRQPTSHCGIHVRPPGLTARGEEGVGSTDGNARERHGLPLWRLGSGPCAPPIDPETFGNWYLSPRRSPYNNVQTFDWFPGTGLTHGDGAMFKAALSVGGGSVY